MQYFFNDLPAAKDFVESAKDLMMQLSFIMGNAIFWKVLETVPLLHQVNINFMWRLCTKITKNFKSMAVLLALISPVSFTFKKMLF